MGLRYSMESMTKFYFVAVAVSNSNRRNYTAVKNTPQESLSAGPVHGAAELYELQKHSSSLSEIFSLVDNWQVQVHTLGTIKLINIKLCSWSRISR